MLIQWLTKFFYDYISILSETSRADFVDQSKMTSALGFKSYQQGANGDNEQQFSEN